MTDRPGAARWQPSRVRRYRAAYPGATASRNPGRSSPLGRTAGQCPARQHSEQKARMARPGQPAATGADAIHGRSTPGARPEKRRSARRRNWRRVPAPGRRPTHWTRHQCPTAAPARKQPCPRPGPTAPPRRPAKWALDPGRLQQEEACAQCPPSSQRFTPTSSAAGPGHRARFRPRGGTPASRWCRRSRSCSSPPRRSSCPAPHWRSSPGHIQDPG